ncbi:MAG: DUF4365 domain-containing protein [Candidatus Korobacteraceae bacterium]|jgi:uncharacterized protein DUF4365
MISKSEEHETDRAGKRLLRSALEGLGWVVNDVEEDYGIDSYVQVFDSGSPTGAWFHVQLKSSRNTAYSADGSFVSQELSIDHARHYAGEMRQPVAVVHADVAAQRVYWCFPQLDTALISALGTTRAKSITMRIPTAHGLPNTAPDLLTALERVHLTLANRELTSASTRDFAESLVHFADQTALARAFQDKNDVLKLGRIVDLYRERKLPEARSRAEVLVADPDSGVEAKFWAEIQLQSIDYHEILHGGKPQSELPRSWLKHAKSLQALTRSGPNHLKFYALIARHSAELNILVHENSSLFMALAQHLHAGENPMMVLGLYARRSVLAQRIAAKYNQCVRLARYAANYRNRWALGRALVGIVHAVAQYIATLGREGLLDSQAAFLGSALQICKLAAWISAETQDPEGIIIAILGALLPGTSEDSDAVRWARQTAEGLADPQARDEALRLIDRAVRRWRGEKVEGDYQGDVLWQAVQNVATGIGLDISDENSPLVRELRIAVTDNSPERVLVDCEHLLVTRGAMGPIARFISDVLGIQTAGSKVVHCTLHDFHAEDRVLDRAYAEFRKAHCDMCPDKAPRPSLWRYDDEARRTEAEKYGGFVRRFIGGPFGLRYTDED